MTRHQELTNRAKLIGKLATGGTACGAANQKRLWKGDLSARVWLPSFTDSIPFYHFSVLSPFLQLFPISFCWFAVMSSPKFPLDDAADDWA